MISPGWADAVARAPNVVTARIATKATVLMRRPATMALPCRCPAMDNSRRKYGEKVPRQDCLKKTGADLLVHARELLVEANCFDATKAGITVRLRTERPS